MIFRFCLFGEFYHVFDDRFLAFSIFNSRFVMEPG